MGTSYAKADGDLQQESKQARSHGPKDKAEEESPLAVPAIQQKNPKQKQRAPTARAKPKLKKENTAEPQTHSI